MIALSAVQSSAQTYIHNGILFIDTSNNAWYNQVHWLIGTSYLSIIASNSSQNSIKGHQYNLRLCKYMTNYPKSFQFYSSPNSLNPTATLLSGDCGSFSSFNQYVSLKVYCNPHVITPHFSTLLVLLRISSLCPTDFIHGTVRSLEWPFLTDCVTPRFEYRGFPR